MQKFKNRPRLLSLKSLDETLITEYPFLWAVRIHYILPLSILVLLINWGISTFLVVDYLHVPDLSIAFYYGCLSALSLFTFWLLTQNIIDFNLLFWGNRILLHLKTIFFFFLVVSLIFASSYIPYLNLQNRIQHTLLDSIFSPYDYVSDSGEDLYYNSRFFEADSTGLHHRKALIHPFSEYSVKGINEALNRNLVSNQQYLNDAAIAGLALDFWGGGRLTNVDSVKNEMSFVVNRRISLQANYRDIGFQKAKVNYKSYKETRIRLKNFDSVEVNRRSYFVTDSLNVPLFTSVIYYYKRSDQRLIYLPSFFAQSYFLRLKIMRSINERNPKLSSDDQLQLLKQITHNVILSVSSTETIFRRQIYFAMLFAAIALMLSAFMTRLFGLVIFLGALFNTACLSGLFALTMTLLDNFLSPSHFDDILTIALFTLACFMLVIIWRIGKIRSRKKFHPLILQTATYLLAICLAIVYAYFVNKLGSRSLFHFGVHNLKVKIFSAGYAIVFFFLFPWLIIGRYYKLFVLPKS